MAVAVAMAQMTTELACRREVRPEGIGASKKGQEQDSRLHLHPPWDVDAEKRVRSPQVYHQTPQHEEAITSGERQWTQ